MYEEVSAQIRGLVEILEVPATGEALIDAFRLWEQMGARILEGVGEYDAVGGWRDNGAVSLISWLCVQFRLSRDEAARLSQSAKRLRDLPVTAGAFRDGVLSEGQMRAIVANLNDELAPLFADAEAGMVPKLAPLTVKDVSSLMQAWAQAAKDSLQDDPGDDPDAATELPERRLHVSRTLDGRREISGSLDAEAGALVDTALRLASTRDVEGEPERSPARRRADALMDICRFFLDHQQSQPGGRHRPHLNVMLRYEDLVDKTGTGSLEDGSRLDAATLQRLACDAGVHRVVTDGRSSILDYSHTHQSIPVNLFNALVVRDRGCRFPGCDRDSSWCEGHHILHWVRHGPTALWNLWSS